MMIEASDYDMVSYVARNLRDVDRIEMHACATEHTRLAEVIERHSVFSFCAFDDGIPCAIWGMVQLRPGVGSAYAFGTDDWGRVVLPMVRQIRNFLAPWACAHGYHRIEAAALASRRDVARFMKLIGAQPEATMRASGAHGEDFILYRWLANEALAKSTSAHGPH